MRLDGLGGPVKKSASGLRAKVNWPNERRQSKLSAAKRHTTVSSASVRRGRCGPGLLAAGGKEFAAEGFEEVPAPDAYQQGGAKEQNGVKAGAALASPVDPLF